MHDIASAFSQSYAEARQKFVAAAKSLALPLEAHAHPRLRGIGSETLSVDVAHWGRRDAPGLLLITSGTHGVEGYCGSGCQVGLLSDAAVQAAVEKNGVAVMLYHAVNPYGFSYTRRGNEDNIDLNRNFRDFSQPIPRNAAYAEIADFIVPKTWPPGPEDEERLGHYLHTRGPAALQAAVSGGQHDFPDGMFFGGRAPAWSNGVLRDILRREGATRRMLIWIDIHTGLGPPGHGEKIFLGRDDRARVERTARIFGNDVTWIAAGTSTSATVTGALYHAALEECPSSEFIGIAMEYGTLSLEQTLSALRAEQWVTNHADADRAQHDAIKRQMRNAFYVDTDEWKAMVYAQMRVAVMQSLRALADGATSAGSRP